MEKFNVFFTIDKSYITHFTVAATSLLANNRDLNFRIFLIHDLEDQSILEKVINYFRRKYNVEIVLLTIEPALFENYKITDHISRATYFRLLLSDIIPSTIDRGLFLDSDLVVTGSIKDLLTAEFKDKYLLANDDPYYAEDSILRINRLGAPTSAYFNAGVLLINLKKWRSENVAGHLIRVAQDKMEQLLWWDQDVLNLYFFDKWDRFEARFNSINYTQKFDQAPTIVHFAGKSKPWHYFNNHPYKSLYWSYLRSTPFWYQVPDDFTFLNVLRKIKRRLSKP